MLITWFLQGIFSLWHHWIWWRLHFLSARKQGSLSSWDFLEVSMAFSYHVFSWFSFYTASSLPFLLLGIPPLLVYGAHQRRLMVEFGAFGNNTLRMWTRQVGNDNMTVHIPSAFLHRRILRSLSMTNLTYSAISCPAHSPREANCNGKRKAEGHRRWVGMALGSVSDTNPQIRSV